MVKPEIRHHLKMAKHEVKNQEYAKAIAHAAIGILMRLTEEDELTKRTDFEIKPIVAEPPETKIPEEPSEDLKETE